MIDQSLILDDLEAESIQILREVAAECRNPVLLYSIGKDSSVLLHLARKAFHPAPLPFPLLHVDTGWKFRDMIAFRDRIAELPGVTVLVHRNEEAARSGVDPIRYPASHYTRLMKTEALKAALDAHGFDAAIGGARRDEEAVRAKERVVSVRRPGHVWDPRAQRPEFWRIPNLRLAPGESLRVFPLSNWTEYDVWAYIAREEIDVVPLYFTAPRPVVRRGDLLIVRDDERLLLGADEELSVREVRFRTLGCYPLTAAVESRALNVDDILEELLHTRHSERQGRLIDHDEPASMERKKREGYF